MSAGQNKNKKFFHFNATSAHRQGATEFSSKCFTPESCESSDLMCFVVVADGCDEMEGEIQSHPDLTESPGCYVI